MSRPHASAAATGSGYRNTFMNLRMNHSRRQNALINRVRPEDAQFLLHQRLFRSGWQLRTIVAAASGYFQAVIVAEAMVRLSEAVESVTERSPGEPSPDAIVTRAAGNAVRIQAAK